MILRLKKLENSWQNRKIPAERETPRIIITLLYIARENGYSTGCYLRRTLVLRKEIFHQGLQKDLFHQALGALLEIPKNTGVQGWKGVSCPQLLPRTYCNSLKIFNKVKISLDFSKFLG
jgi:hypothetical protein